MKKFFAISSALAATLVPAHAAQIVLAPSNAIASNQDYGPTFTRGNIFDQQTGPISDTTNDTFADNNYWLNAQSGPAAASITIDLGTAYTIGSFELFNTHNGVFNDRGTANFSIVGGNALSGSSITGAVTLAVGTLARVFNGSPITSQSFNVSDTGTYRYLQFLPTSVPSGANQSVSYGLNELRVFDAPALSGAVPEPATWAMLLAGFGLAGAALRRRRASVKVQYAI